MVRKKKIISLYFVLISNFYHVKYQNQICLKRPLFFICLSFLHIFSQCSIPFSLSPPTKKIMLDLALGVIQLFSKELVMLIWKV
ncbi:hypothetical protein CICLE_v10010062mg [Citrus x clementina]|uniref:Uncharacterized protein n=1 Tax=Citrus clementina TaxID=85681 RepID=V4UN23_CITCL|nr:hypothetical protein CICLE_v10010062mg [Citrus x clementina]